MSALAVPHLFRYEGESALTGGGLELVGAAAPDGRDAPFFSGVLRAPHRASRLLRALMTVVQSRFHLPAAMVRRLVALADPLVTCSEDRLRFEGFSACCGAYARVDLLPESLDGTVQQRGCTNVDFNPPMLAALALVRPRERLALDIRSPGLELTRGSTRVVEKRVALPVRWLKGLVEAQAVQARMECAAEVSGAEARRFLRGLPRMKTHRHATFVIPAGRGLRITQLDSPGAVRVGGLERLRVLEPVADDAQTLRVYRDPVTGASAWELRFVDSRLHLVVSPEVWRGFSGEGQTLASLVETDWRDTLPRVRAELRWQAVLDEETIYRRVARGEDGSAAAVRGALAALGSQGLVGFDLGEGAWFHRELPFDLERVDRLHPRLRDARRLIAAGSVRVGSKSEAEIELFVATTGTEHRVRLTDDESRCTCPWFAKHGAQRGPCKHILAAHLFCEESDDGR